MLIQNKKNASQTGQALIEYSLLILLVVLIVVLVLPTFGQRIESIFSIANGSLNSEQSLQDSPEAIRLLILSDISQRILDYYAQYNKWPRTWGDYAYTDIGLNPVDWSGPVEGIYWKPHGSNIGLANKAGDNIQVYIQDLNGNKLHLYDNWNIWYDVSGSTYYFHTIAPGNEVDISTLEIIEE